MQHDANVEQCAELYELASALDRFTSDFMAIAGSIRSSANADESLARQWLLQIRDRMDVAERAVRQAHVSLQNYRPCYDEYGTDTTYYVYRQLESAYEQAQSEYSEAASRYSEAHSRFVQLQQLIQQGINVAAGAANAISRLGHDASHTVRRAADAIANYED